MKGYIKLIPVILLGVFLACSGSSNEEESGNNNGGGTGTDISGRWYVEVSFSGTGYANPYVADIEQTDTSFTGLIMWGTKYARSFSGVINGTALNFTSSDDSLHFEGRVETSDSIAGTWFNKFTSDSGTWFAIRPFANYNMNGEFSGNFFFMNGISLDTVEVQNGLWKGKAFKTVHGDTTYFAGEMFAIGDNDTMSSDVPMGGFVFNDTLFIDFGCSIRGINGMFNFTGIVSGDSASGNWVVAPVSGNSMWGNGNFNGYIGGALR